MIEITAKTIMNVILYTRVSTKEQVQGYSLSSQEKMCREYAEKQSWSIVEVFQEQGESAKTADRTQLGKMLDIAYEIEVRLMRFWSINWIDLPETLLTITVSGQL